MKQNELHTIRDATASALEESIFAWIDAMRDIHANPQIAYTALIMFFGHALAAVACEMEVAPNPTEVGAVIADTLEEQMEEMLGDVVPVH